MTNISTDVDHLLCDEVSRCAAQVPSDAVSMLDFDRQAIESLFVLADRLRETPSEATRRLMPGKIVATLFYQPSTRTRLNFEAAAHRLGCSVIGFADPATSRAGDFYKETLTDVAAFTSVLCDLIVVRHSVTGAVPELVASSRVPIINAGDGYNEHPTQALGDIYTMRKLVGNLKSAALGFVGDLRIRSLRSIMFGLRHFGPRLILFLLPPGDTVPECVARVLAEAAIPWRAVQSIDALYDSADIIETIGLNHPNHESSRDLSGQWSATPDRYRITRERLEAHDKSPYVMHPGPRTDEVAVDVDNTPNAKYFEQAANGMWVRMALLAALLKRTDRYPIHRQPRSL
jgi:aspartate carbamoyltransferase catalytic subunit